MTKPRPSHEHIISLAAEGLTNQQIADRLGFTVRTLDRDRAKYPALSDGIKAARRVYLEDHRPGHSTPRRYAIGCRCRPCTAANTIRCYEERMARRARLGLPPPDPNRGRRRSVAETVRPGLIVNPSRETQIAQAIARGEPTSLIMRRLTCEYEAVQAVRESLTEAAAS